MPKHLMKTIKNTEKKFYQRGERMKRAMYESIELPSEIRDPLRSICLLKQGLTDPNKPVTGGFIFEMDANKNVALYASFNASMKVYSLEELTGELDKVYRSAVDLKDDNVRYETAAAKTFIEHIGNFIYMNVPDIRKGVQYFMDKEDLPKILQNTSRVYPGEEITDYTDEYYESEIQPIER